MKTSVLFSMIAVAFVLNLNTAHAEENMMNSAHSKHTVSHSTLFDVLYAGEEELKEVSEWMLNPDAFESEVEIIEIEPWMLDEGAFAEISVDVEDWMLDATLFEGGEDLVEIEDWMLDADSFATTTNHTEEPFREIEDWMFKL